PYVGAAAAGIALLVFIPLTGIFGLSGPWHYLVAVALAVAAGWVVSRVSSADRPICALVAAVWHELAVPRPPRARPGSGARPPATELAPIAGSAACGRAAGPRPGSASAPARAGRRGAAPVRARRRAFAAPSRPPGAAGSAVRGDARSCCSRRRPRAPRPPPQAR